MAEHDDGGPAFPKPDCPQMDAQHGMSLWDLYFGIAWESLGSLNWGDSWEARARQAANAADAMIAERNKRINRKAGEA